MGRGEHEVGSGAWPPAGTLRIGCSCFSVAQVLVKEAGNVTTTDSAMGQIEGHFQVK